MTEVIIRPEQPRQAARLKCRFAIDAAPGHPFQKAIWDREFERAKYQTADWFVQDMYKEGWTYQQAFPWRLRGPFPVIPIITLPKRSQQKRWNEPSADLLKAILNGYRPDSRGDDLGVKTIAGLAENERWEYELSAVFTRPAIPIDKPTEQEEMAMLRQG